MAGAFTHQEINSIQKKLKQAARTFAATYGMKKTTVEQLTDYAGISKGAFYKFYETKEHIFLELTDELHNELFSKAAEVMQSATGEPVKDRLALAIRICVQRVEDSGFAGFLADESRYLTRKLPLGALMKHRKNDEESVNQILAMLGAELNVSFDMLSSLGRSLMLLVARRQEIGPEFDGMLEILIDGVCGQLFPPNEEYFIS